MPNPTPPPNLNANSLSVGGKPTDSPTKAGVFIIGTDTEVGKTFQACRLARTLRERGGRVGVYKPVASGSLTPYNPSTANPTTGGSDAELLQAAAQSPEMLSRICPQSFAAPIAPPMSAQLEGRKVDERLLLEGAQWWLTRCDFLIVEGAGGALSPISESLLVLDLAQQLNLPIVLVAANRLGVVNHTLLTWEAIRSRQLELLGIVLNNLPCGPIAPTASAAESRLAAESELARGTNRKLLQRFTDCPIVDNIEELLDAAFRTPPGRPAI